MRELDEAQILSGETEEDKEVRDNSHVWLGVMVVTWPVDMITFLSMPFVESAGSVCVTNAAVSSPEMAMPVMNLNWAEEPVPSWYVAEPPARSARVFAWMSSL